MWGDAVSDVVCTAVHGQIAVLEPIRSLSEMPSVDGSSILSLSETQAVACSPIQSRLPFTKRRNSTKP